MSMAFHDDPFDHRLSISRMLDEHLLRRGMRETLLHDPVAGYQVQVLRDVLNIVAMAMEEERVPHDVRKRVLEKVIYGGAPQRAEAQRRIAEYEAHVRDMMYTSPQAH